MVRTKQSRGPWVTAAALFTVVFFLYLINVSRSSPLDRTPHATNYRSSQRIGSSEPTVQVSEVELEGNVLLYTKTVEGAKPDLLWLSLRYDRTSWGKNDNAGKRTVVDFLRIVSSQHNVMTTSLGILTSSVDEYTTYKSIVDKMQFPRLVLIMHPGFHDGPVVDREHRHDDNVQAARRAEISKLRNFLMLRALREEQHILWTDADVFKLDTGIVDRMIKHVRDDDEVGLLTARCSLGDVDNYDYNAWNGTRQGPRGWDLTDEEISNGELKLQGQHHVAEIIKGSSNDDLFPLQTVGATILYMRASLIWRGLNFPHQYVIGTRWNKDGWDGIESEGLCYRARGLKGGRCMVLGGSWHVAHTTG